ncbi:MAG TPA: META domain-containing protein [Frankiaceae bacterium]|nr:META domain-containing protein [Frankiaceae bacterium]
MRARLLATALVTATVLCGCSASAERPAPRPPTVASATPAVTPVGLNWRLVEYRLPRQPPVVVASDSTLTLKPGGRYYAQACNGYDGPYQVVGDRIDFQGGGGSQMQCHGAQNQLEEDFYRVLRDVTWRIDGPRLTLRADDGATFVYESPDSLVPDTGRTVAEGARNGRRYRVWTRGRGNDVVLRVASLDVAGRGLGSGVTPSPHVDEYRRTVTAGSGPEVQVVAGFAPVGTVRITYRKPKRGPEAELRLHDVPGVRWPVFTGFVERGIDGWLMTAYDARERRLAPFTGERPF